MGSVGDSYDNALMENFFSTLKIELVYRNSWRTRDEAENAIFSYIDGWYNTQRIQKELGWLSPDECEAAWQADQLEPSIIPASPTGAMLPTDERSRMLCAVQIAYFAVDVTRGGQDPDQQALFPHLVHLLADQLDQAQQRGGVPAHFDTRLEADALATMTAGLLSAMLVEAYDTEQATRIIDYRLGHLFAG